jgi:hypothetical protein
MAAVGYEHCLTQTRGETRKQDCELKAFARLAHMPS